MKRQNILSAFRHAFAGIWFSILAERNMKIHVFAAIVVVFLTYWMGLDQYEIVIVTLTIAGVLAAELINTAVEAMVDLISPEYHPLAKIAKNAAAGAVLVMAVASLIVGYILFAPRIGG